MRLIFALSLYSVVARAQANAPLERVRADLEALRPHAQQHRETRGATPALTAIKHGLRDWAERKLNDLTGDEDSFNRGLQEDAAHAGLLCKDGCPLTAIGYADAVRIHRQGEFLKVQTSVGIQCGYDDSAYLYERVNGKWSRIFETEQNTYTAAGYLPQTIYSVDVSAPDASGTRLVVSLGSKPGCSNAFQPLYSRIWRIVNGAKPKLLLDSQETAYIGAYPPARATLTPNDIRIEFTAGGTGYGEGHQAERRFSVKANAAKQVEPIAPTPRDFVEEWLAGPWNQVRQWSESASLQAAHDRLQRRDGRGDFPDPPQQCAKDATLWQIGIRLHGSDAKTYYLVRWQQPDHFAMIAISDRAVCPD